MSTLLRILALMLILPWPPAAGAQTLVDPTRPPGALAAPGGEVAAGGPVLQSVMLSSGRKLAVISGELVALGGRYGAARLVRLTESEAVLKNGQETTVLRLFPLVEKRIAGDTKKQKQATKAKQ